MRRKILIMGLPGAGKTTLADALTPRLSAVRFNADEVRHHVNRDLGFAEADRVEHARRMGWLCDQAVKAGVFAVADFICPTPATRAAFLEGGDAFMVWCDRIKTSRFADTNQLFVPPQRYDLRVGPEGAPEYWTGEIVRHVRPAFDSTKPTALIIGRFQPFREDHRALILEVLKRVGQVCIAVRATQGSDAKNPLPFAEVRADIEHAFRQHEGRFEVIQVPNISHLFHGRDAGYIVERIELDPATETRRRGTPPFEQHPR